MLKGYANIISHWNENYLAVNIADVRRGEGVSPYADRGGWGWKSWLFADVLYG